LNGAYSATIQFPQFTESGIWVVSDVDCVDNVFNRNVIATTQLQALGFPTQLSVISNPDTTAPQIVSFNLNPPSIDVPSGQQNVTITLGLTDDLSGVDFSLHGGSGASLVMQSPSGKQTQVIANDRFTLVSGTNLNGVWQTTLTIPQFSEAGVWTLQRLLLEDVVGNFSILNASDLLARGLSSDLQVASSPSDVLPPQLSGLTIAPDHINTSTGSQTIVVTITATDNLSGVSFMPSFPFTTCFLGDTTNIFKRVGVLLISPSGNQTRCLEPDLGFGSGPINQISGTPENGVWQGTVTFPQFSEAGIWKASLILKDAVENFVSFDTTTLASLGAQTDLVIVQSPVVTLSTNTLGFSDQVIGTVSAAMTATLTNTGSTTLGISGISATSDFLQSNTCGVLLPAGANCTVNVIFAPSATGTRSGSLVINDDAPGSPHIINLIGTGISNNNPPPCTFSLSPTGQSFGPEGGEGSFAVNTGAGCNWNAATMANWITILPGGSCTRVGDVVTCPQGGGAVSFFVSTNGGAGRSATITVADQSFHIDQQGTTPCSFSINPSHASIDDIGGPLRVVITTSSTACQWTAASNATWLALTSSAFGTGVGAVTLNVSPNTGGSRMGTVTIAGQTFSVTQGGGTCGAVDVTPETDVRRSGFTYIYPSSYEYSETITVRNISTQTLRAPLFLVLIGVPNHQSFPNGNGVFGSLQTTCFSSQGDAMVLLPSGDLQPGKTTGAQLLFFTQSLLGRIQYSTKVLSGQPVK
jgi:hypothetical protein